MKIPWLMVLKVRSPETKFGFYIFLPLIYLLLLPFLLIGAVVFALMVAFRANTKSRKTALAVLVYGPRLLAAARGTEIDVHSEESDVTILVK